MKFAIHLGLLRNVQDELIELGLKQDRIEYDLDSPEWYWMPHEWNRFRTESINIQHKIRLANKKLDRELAEAYSCG